MCALVSVSVAWVCEDRVGAACVVFVCGVWEKGESVLFRVCIGCSSRYSRCFWDLVHVCVPLSQPARVRGGGVTTCVFDVM